MRTPKSMMSGDPEALNAKSAGDTKQVADTFAPPSDFSTTPLVTEEERKTGEVKGASSTLRSTAVSGYPAGAK